MARPFTSKPALSTRSDRDVLGPSGSGTVLLPGDQEIDIRIGRDGGRANLRMRIKLHCPRFAMELGGAEAAKQTAELYAKILRRNLASGRGAQGQALPAIKQATIARRERRKRERVEVSRSAKTNKYGRVVGFKEKVTSGQAKAERMKVRGGPNKSKPYDTIDTQTPFHESGLAAESIVVNHKGTESGDATFLVAMASGGQDRGLSFDDGKGARLFAARHYGFDTIMDLPNEGDVGVMQILDAHYSAVLELGHSVVALLHDFNEMAEDFSEFVDDASGSD